MGELILWKPLYYATIVIYLFAALEFIIGDGFGMIVLFFLIALWSRIPCLISTFTKDMECIDFFTVMLAINLGGATGGFFGFTAMLFSRIFGPEEWLPFTIKDAFSLLFAGIITPAMYYATGGNFIYTMYGFTIVRYVLYLVFTYFFEREAMMLELGYCAVGIVTAYITNTIYGLYLEPLLSPLFEEGVSLNWGFFFVMTLIIVGIVVFSKVLNRWEVSRSAKKNQAFA